MVLTLQPVTFSQVCSFITEHHRHHLPPQGWKFGIGVHDGKTLVGVATVGRPVSRLLDDGLTLEVTRCCTNGTKNACSILYGACRRAASALGYKRLITYTLKSESGKSLIASGYKILWQTSGGSWNRPIRERIDKHDTQQKICWQA